jgi:hypothetical protein
MLFKHHCKEIIFPVYVFNNAEQLKRAVIRTLKKSGDEYNPDFVNVDNKAGRTTYIDGYGAFIYIENLKNIGIISHEFHHAIALHMQYIGSQCFELPAYLMGYLIQKYCDKVLKN